VNGSALTRSQGKNLLSGYANLGLAGLITLFVTPFYAHALGATQWGVVALCMTMQGALFAIDIALGPLMLRDVGHAPSLHQAYAVFLKFRRIYSTVGFGLFVLGQALLIALVYGPESAMPIRYQPVLPALQLILVQFLFQFVNNAAIGYWNGRQLQVRANFRLVIFTLMKHSFALAAVLLWEPSATAYLLPFAVISAIECTVNMRRIQLDLATNIASVRPDKPVTQAPAGDAPRALFAFCVAMGLAVLSGLIDRIFLSFAVPTEAYGAYFLVSTLMLSMLSLQMPIQRTFLPQMAAAPSSWHVLIATFKASLLLLVMPAIVVAIFSESVLRLWLHDPLIATLGAPVLRWMMMAVALCGLYAPMGLWLLSRRRYGLMLTINGCALAVQCVLLILLTPRIGMDAGGIAWVGCGAVQALFAGYLCLTLRSGGAHAAFASR
jgi:O-antigen/teichoic acid export membrane protein